MLRLKPEVAGRFEHLLSRSMCKDVDELLAGISRTYRSINTYFVAEDSFRETLRVRPHTVAGAHRCVDEGAVEITVYADVVAEPVGDLCGELVPYTEFSGERDMVVEDLDPRTLTRVLGEIARSEELCWYPRIARTLRRDTWRDMLLVQGCDWRVRLMVTKLSGFEIRAVYRGALRRSGVDILVVSTLHESHEPGPASTVATVRRLWERFSELSPSITLVLRLGCGF